MFLLRLSLRNVLRHRLRSTLSALVVMSGVWVLIVGQGFIGGLRENIIRANVDTMAGHLSLRPKNYPDAGFEAPLDGVFEVDEEMISQVERLSLAWTSRTYALANANAYPNTLRVRLIGFDPETDASVFPRTGWKLVGKEPKADAVMVSTGVAKLFGLSVGDVLTLSLRTAAGSINAMTMPVAGIYSVGNPLLDGTGVLVPKPVMAMLIDTQAVSHVSIRLKSRHQAEAVAAQLDEVYGDRLDTVTWIEATEDLLALQEIRQKSLNFLVFILLAIAGLGIANTILMAAFERMREIGTLRAMGMRRRAVLGMFLVEGGLIGFGGGLIGAVVGAWMMYHYSVNPIDMTPLIEGKGAENFPISTLLYTRYSPTLAVSSLGFGVVVSVLASIYPSIVATAMAPADAVRAD
jgi:ABC-type lipoprotein release transport system permease subunit